MEIIVRRAAEKDIEVIAMNVVDMAYESSQEKLAPETVLQGVTSLFKRPELGFYVVAEIDQKVVGSLVIVYEWSDWRNGLHWWIHSVYVQPSFRRKGIYSKMYTFIRNEALGSSEFRSLRLSTDKTNTIARDAYEHLGMKEGTSVTYYAT